MTISSISAEEIRPDLAPKKIDRSKSPIPRILAKCEFTLENLLNLI